MMTKSDSSLAAESGIPNSSATRLAFSMLGDIRDPTLGLMLADTFLLIPPELWLSLSWISLLHTKEPVFLFLAPVARKLVSIAYKSSGDTYCSNLRKLGCPLLFSLPSAKGDPITQTCLRFSVNSLVIIVYWLDWDFCFDFLWPSLSLQFPLELNRKLYLNCLK